MCQLLGMNANTPTDVMFSFTGLATRADEHKDGFGIAFFEDKGLRHFKMDFTFVAKTAVPKQTAHVALAGAEVRRTPVDVKTSAATLAP